MSDLLADLEPIEGFPTVDQMRAFALALADDHPERVSVRDIGVSRGGIPLQLLKLSGAAATQRVLIIGMPHPNEPIGMATIVTLCQRLLADPAALDATGADWYFVPCADADGTRLNEGWFGGPWTREHYFRHFFRPASDAQVEWTFPFSTDGFSVNAPIPETLALMAAIDEVRPTVLASLHNAEMGGAYFYATAGADALYPQLTELCTRYGIPLHLGEPELPTATVLAPAVFEVPTGQDLYDLATMVGVDPADFVSGGNSLDYARTHNDVSGVVIELPYWCDERAGDTSPHPSGLSRREVALQGIDAIEAAHLLVAEFHTAASPLPPGPLSDAVTGWLSHGAASIIGGQRHEAETDPAFEAPVTVAEQFSVVEELHSIRLRLLGMLLRALPLDSPVREAAEETFAEWSAAAAKDDESHVIPIADLVAVQGGSILAALEHARSR